jgi:divalent metal cation (Fe/Co/Zn/Cd) transporter
VSITVSPTLTVREAHQIAVEADGRLRKALPFLASVMVHVDPSDAAGEEHHHEPS